MIGMEDSRTSDTLKLRKLGGFRFFVRFKWPKVDYVDLYRSVRPTDEGV